MTPGGNASAAAAWRYGYYDQPAVDSGDTGTSEPDLPLGGRVSARSRRVRAREAATMTEPLDTVAGDEPATDQAAEGTTEDAADSTPVDEAEGP